MTSLGQLIQWNGLYDWSAATVYGTGFLGKASVEEGSGRSAIYMKEQFKSLC